MRPKDVALGRELENKMRSFGRSLPGIQMSVNRATFIEQIVESMRRVRYVEIIRQKKLSDLCADPSNECFDPLKTAILSLRQGSIDEVFWLVFLFVYFGKNRRTGWRLLRNVYGCLRTGERWNWERTNSDLAGFKNWLRANEIALKQDKAGFGNHRKYESLKSTSTRGTGAAVESYIRWVDPVRTHRGLIEVTRSRVGTDPKLVFDDLYHSMDVISFGRTAKFDYLTMIGKMGLAAIEPGTPYLQGSTGPLRGARLLFGSTSTTNLSAKDLDSRVVHLGAELNVGMQVLEDALCNWQKSPGHFVAFRG